VFRYQVSGMNCGHCVNTVDRAVKAVAPGATVAVDLKAGEVSVAGAADAAAVAAAIADAGYEAVLKAA